MRAVKGLILLGFLAIIGAGKLYAAPTSLLKCLAREEDKIHKYKWGVPISTLNQKLISKIAVYPDLEVKPGFLHSICRSDSPSVKLLEAMLIHERKIFAEPKFKTMSHRGQYQSSIEELTQELPDLFFYYVGTIQIMVDDVECFQNHIPEISTLGDLYQHLALENTSQEIFHRENRMKRIFKKLRRFPEIKKSCAVKAVSNAKKTQKKSKLIALNKPLWGF